MAKTPTEPAIYSSLGLRNYQHPDKFGQWLGYKAVDVDRMSRTARVELEIREDHLSPAGKVHGGVVSAFFDFACGAAVFSTLGPNDFCSTVELKVNYFHPLHLGDRLTAETEVVFRGKKLCVIHGRLYRGEDRELPVAMVTATFNVITAAATTVAGTPAGSAGPGVAGSGGDAPSGARR